MMKIFLTGSLLISLSACKLFDGGGGAVGKESLEPQVQSHVLIVTMGGWGSCRGLFRPTPEGSFLDAQAKNLAQNLKDAGVNVRSLTTCLTKGAPPLPGRSFAFAHDHSETQATEEATENFTDLVTRTWEDQGKPQIIAIGHSYGGYMAMRLAESFREKTGTSLFRLFTIDPISAETCRIAPVLFSLGGQLPPGCLRAPGTAVTNQALVGDTMDLARVAARTEKWMNFHVDFDQPRCLKGMHSSPVPQLSNVGNQVIAAPETTLQPIDPLDPFGNCHHRIGFAPALWTGSTSSPAISICGELARDLHIDASACVPIEVDVRTGR